MGGGGGPAAASLVPTPSRRQLEIFIKLQLYGDSNVLSPSVSGWCVVQRRKTLLKEYERERQGKPSLFVAMWIGQRSQVMEEFERAIFEDATGVQGEYTFDDAIGVC